MKSHATISTLFPYTTLFRSCDVDSQKLNKAAAGYPNAKKFINYREMLNTMENQIDAVVVSTPDHNHAPISLMAMEMNKNVYCQKPLAQYVSETREMDKVAREKNLVTQMGIQVHSFYDYVLATERSEEHTSELQSRGHLVCRLLLEKKKKKKSK